MLNNELNKLAYSCFLISINEIIAKDSDLQGVITSKISSLGQSAIEQLHDYCSKADVALDGLTVDDVCLLTSALSKQENPNIDALARKAVYAQKYLDILKQFDQCDSTDQAIKDCITKICALFPKDTEAQSSAIAHFIDSRAISLEKIPIENLRAAIPYIRIAIISCPNEILDNQLYEILEAGKNIEFLEIKESYLETLPCLPKCKQVFLLYMFELKTIAPLPECNTFYIQTASELKKIESLPKCISFKCADTPALETIPLDMHCRDFSVLGSKDEKPKKWPTLTQLPPLDECMHPEIINCHTKEPLILHGLQGEGARDVKEKSGATATCIGFRKTPFGKIYTFKLKDEFNLSNKDFAPFVYEHAQKMMEETYPAVESSFETIKHLIDSGMKIPAINKLHSSSMLGYSYFENKETDEVYFSIPSVDVLKKYWSQLAEQNKKLPELEIFNSEGIASNSEFIDAFLGCDAILSNGPEFLHDQFNHVLPTILNMFNEKYSNCREDFKEIIKECKNLIDSHSTDENQRHSLEHMLGYFVDLCSADIISFHFFRDIASYKKGNLDLKRLFLNFLEHQFNMLQNTEIYQKMKNKDLRDDISKGPELWKKIFPELNAPTTSE